MQAIKALQVRKSAKQTRQRQLSLEKIIGFAKRITNLDESIT